MLHFHPKEAKVLNVNIVKGIDLVGYLSFSMWLPQVKIIYFNSSCLVLTLF